MSETMLIWLFGIVGLWCLTNTATIYTLVVIVSKLKTILIMTSKRAADILHSPDDHLGLDALLEKHKDGPHRLTSEEWDVLKRECDKIVANPANTKSERLAALFIVEFSLDRLEGMKIIK